MKIFIFIASLIAILLSGCAEKKIHLSIDSFPIGAQIISLENNTTLGMTPLDIYIPYSTLFGTNQSLSCINQTGFSLLWASGASAKIESFTLCPQESTKNFIINRPVETPNLEYDLKYAETLNEQQKIRLMKAQVDAIQSAATAQEWHNFNQQMLNQQRIYELRRIHYLRYGN